MALRGERARAQMSRESASAKPGILRLGPILVNRLTYSVVIGKKKIELTKGQFDLLCFLFENRNRVVGSSEIARIVFGCVSGDTSLLVRVHVCHLRRALLREGRLIETVRGRGYRLVEIRKVVRGSS